MSSVEADTDAVLSLVPAPRLAPYLALAGGDRGRALALYEWGARVSAAAFEDIAHLEVLLRGGMDRVLRAHFREAERGIPWFLLPVPGGEYVAEASGRVRERLRQEGRETRDQVVAAMSFGFWSGMLGPGYEELWRACLHRAFPGSSGRRAEVAATAEGVRRFRNRIAHHDSVLGVDFPFEVRQVAELAAFVDPAAGRWLRSRSRTMDVYAQRPATPDDTLVVSAPGALFLYERCRAHVTRAGQAFAGVDRMAFRVDDMIAPDLPRVLLRRDNVEWTERGAIRLRRTRDPWDRRIAEVVEDSLVTGRDGGRRQVFLLTGPDEPGHRRLAGPLPVNGDASGTAAAGKDGSGGGGEGLAGRPVPEYAYTRLHALETGAAG
ncbi:hypothetical protein [Nocardiopsis tropica]|uniref:Abi-like protein n=1 Tax=Nocardiopsis tropica TaxID=109330 RepID=A0ABV1ZUB1_9ACTN